MNGKRLTVSIVCILQLILVIIWTALLWGSSPHKGTILNLGLLGIAGVLGLITQANGKFKIGVIILNWLETGMWSLGLLGYMVKFSKYATDIEMKGMLIFTFLLTLLIVILCVINGVLVIMLPNKQYIKKLKQLIK